MSVDYQKPPQRESNLRGPIIRISLTVVGVFALLWVLLTPRMRSGRGAQEKAAPLDIQNISAALETFRADNGRYPTTAEGLDALFEKPAGSGLPGWKRV
jgi:general secretion pathway protein G